MRPNEKEILTRCLEHTMRGGTPVDNVWYQNHNDVLAQILDEECVFIKTEDVVLFFEKPWKWEQDMREILEADEELSTLVEEKKAGVSPHAEET